MATSTTSSIPISGSTPRYPGFRSNAGIRAEVWMGKCKIAIEDAFHHHPKLATAATIAAIAGSALLLKRALARHQVARNTVLELTIGGTDVVEGKDSGFLGLLRQGQLLESAVVLSDLVQTLDAASRDRNVLGLVATFKDDLRFGLAQIQELRDAIKRFRAGGKKAVVFAPAFGEWSDGKMGYYLASAFDEIIVPLSGNVGLVGMMLSKQYLKNTLERIDAVPEIGKRKDYKTAVNTFTEEEMTEREKEMMQSMLESIFGQMVADVSQDRGIELEKTRSLFEEGPYSASEAYELGLIDGMAYKDDVYHVILPQVFGMPKKDLKLLFFSRYLAKIGKPRGLYSHPRVPLISFRKPRQVVGLITCEGPILLGESKPNFSGRDGATIGADTVTVALREAREDPAVHTIVLRVNSPGGSYTASDIITREVMRAREAGKKIEIQVIVSMSNYAASGGYFISCFADRIVASPSTLTGSIGVFVGKLVYRGTLAKVGVTCDQVYTTDNSKLFSGMFPYGEGRAHVEKALDRIYSDFCAKVAEGRSLDAEKVEEVAQGRVWTGLQAKENGLVDEIGGLHRALELAREGMGQTEEEFTVKIFPKGKSLLQLLSEPQNSEEKGAGLSIGSTVAYCLMRPFEGAITWAVTSLVLPFLGVGSSMRAMMGPAELRQLAQTGSVGMVHAAAPDIKLN